MEKSVDIDKDFYIRLFYHGNPGNIILMYLTALKLQNYLGYGKLANVKIPLFNINIPDIPNGRIGLHDHVTTNSIQYGYVPLQGFSHIIPRSNATFLSLEGFCQHMDNYPSTHSLDYDKYFPCLPDNEGGKDDELVINIRGGEILEGIHPHYCLIPPEFYEFIIKKTNKKPIFYGQLTPSLYMDEIRSRFPEATYIDSRGVEADFDFLRKSKHIIISISTFSWLAAWLSNATKIYFPVLGMFNPWQHQSMLLPFNDERYEFYLFPVCFSKHVKEYEDYLDPIRYSWHFIDHKTLENTIPKPDFMFDHYLRALDVNFYINEANDKQKKSLEETYNHFGSAGVYNYYIKEGFLKGDRVCPFDDMYYIQQYPWIATEVLHGQYQNLKSHYLQKGQYMDLVNIRR